MTGGRAALLRTRSSCPPRIGASMSAGGTADRHPGGESLHPAGRSASNARSGGVARSRVPCARRIVAVGPLQQGVEPVGLVVDRRVGVAILREARRNRCEREIFRAYIV